MKTTKIKNKSKSFAKPFPLRLREPLLILVVAIGLFLVLSLLTYTPADPAGFAVLKNQAVMNGGGKLGAFLSSSLIHLFGYFSFVFPFMLFYGVWLYFRYRGAMDQEQFAYFRMLRVAGFFFILIPGCALASLHVAIDWAPGVTGGGFIGRRMALGMVHFVNVSGTDLLLTAFFLGGITLFTGLSWLTVADVLGDALWRANRSIRAILSRIDQWAMNSSVKEERLGEIEPIILPKRQPKIMRVEPKLESVAPPEPMMLSKKVDVEPALFEPPLAGTLPPLSLLDPPNHSHVKGYTNQQLEEISREVELRLQDFGIQVKVVAVHPGPVVTRFELQLAAGTKVSRITALAKDLARSLSVISVRVVEIIPGKPVIGLELPNIDREIVRLSEILAADLYQSAFSPLTLAMGKDISGCPVAVDLAKMPHLLVAGTTGSGKSVGLNAMLLSLLYKATPAQLRLILIDPKMLELSVYEGIPHLLTPVVTDMKDAANALRWGVAEMDRRYRLMAFLGVRNIAGYNAKVKEAENKGTPLFDPFLPGDLSQDNPPPLTNLPYIVVLVDEFADMMMLVGKKVEELIARIAQKARAAGIHLILATQRPSVDVITGLIKANIPTRVAFQVSSKIDSRTILDQQGAEQLLGHGDMLYLPPGTGVPIRVHGAFVADEEVHRVVYDIKRRGQPQYLEEILQGEATDPGSESAIEGEVTGEQDPLYDQAVQIVVESRRASISHIQRRLKIGYNRAANIVEAMEAAGVVTGMDSSGVREVLVAEAQ